jgi:copper chaperone CopZ
MKSTIVTINGLHCNSCKLLIEDECKDMKDIKSCDVDLKTGKTIIEHDKEFNPESFKSNVEKLGGYKVSFN